MPNFVANPDYRDLLNSTKIEQKGSQAVLTATIPNSLLQELAIAPDKLSGSASSGK
jgi:hypothetical protein